MQSFRAARRPNAAGLSLSSRASDAKYFDLIFFAELRSSQYLLLRWCSRGYDTRREHCTLPGTIICANFSFTFCRLAVCQYTWRWDTLGAQSFGVRCWISHPVFPAVHDYCQRLKYILLCCNLRYYLLSHSTESRQGGYFLACISLMNFWSEVPLGQGLYIQEPRHSSRTFSQPHAVCTPPNLSSIYSESTNFARLQCSHSRSCFRSEQHSCCLFQATAPTQSHLRLVMLTALHSCSSTQKTTCERSRVTPEMESRWGSA